MAKLFLISYNESVLPKQKLVTLFDKMPGVLTWFSQMPGSFFIKTQDLFSAEKISKLIEEKSGNTTHVIVKIHNTLSEDYYGRISKELWDNFYNL
jgi:hypothetical protein